MSGAQQAGSNTASPSHPADSILEESERVMSECASVLARLETIHNRYMGGDTKADEPSPSVPEPPGALNVTVYRLRTAISSIRQSHAILDQL